MKKLLAIFAFFISGFVSYVVADVTAPSGRFLQIRDTLQPSSTVYFSSGTVQTYLSANGIMSLPHSATPPPADCSTDAHFGRVYVDTNAATNFILYACEGTLGWKQVGTAGSGGSQTTILVKDGGSSIVNTSTLNFTGASFVISNSGGEGLVAIDFSSITSRADVILNQNSLQSGATFYVSSGTVNGQLSVTSIKFPNGTIQVSSPTAGAGSSPGGSDTNVQFNDASAFGGESNFSWNKSSDTLILMSSYTTGSNISALVILSSANATNSPAGNISFNFKDLAGSTQAVFQIQPAQAFTDTSTSTLVSFKVRGDNQLETIMRIGEPSGSTIPYVEFPTTGTRLNLKGVSNDDAYIENNTSSSDLVIAPPPTVGRIRLGSGSKGDVVILLDTSASDGDLDWDGVNDVLKVSDDIQMQAQNEVRFADSDSSNYSGFKASATITSNAVFTIPSADGTSGQALVTNGNKVLSFATISGGGGGGGGYSVEPATVTFILDKGVKSSTLTLTSLSSGVMHIVSGSSNVATGLVSLSTEVTGVLPLANMSSGATYYIQNTNTLQVASTYFVQQGLINGQLGIGDSSPTAPLQIKSSSSGSAMIRLVQSGVPWTGDTDMEWYNGPSGFESISASLGLQNTNNYPLRLKNNSGTTIVNLNTRNSVPSDFIYGVNVNNTGVYGFKPTSVIGTDKTISFGDGYFFRVNPSGANRTITLPNVGNLGGGIDSASLIICKTDTSTNTVSFAVASGDTLAESVVLANQGECVTYVSSVAASSNSGFWYTAHNGLPYPGATVGRALITNNGKWSIGLASAASNTTQNNFPMGDANGSLQPSSLNYLASYPIFVGSVVYGDNILAIGDMGGLTASLINGALNAKMSFGVGSGFTTSYRANVPDTPPGAYQAWTSTGPTGNQFQFQNTTVIVSTNGLQTGATFYVSSGTILNLNSSTITLNTIQFGNGVVLNGNNALSTANALKFSSTNTVIIGATTLEKSLNGTGVGSSTFTANAFSNGFTFRVKAAGSYEQGSANVTFRLKVGTITVGDSGVQTLGTGNKSWSFDSIITIRSTGFGGSLAAQSYFFPQTSGSDIMFGLTNNTTHHVNTLIDNPITLTAQFDVADTTITATNFLIDSLVVSTATYNNVNPTREILIPMAGMWPVEATADSFAPIGVSTGSTLDSITANFDSATDQCRGYSFMVPPEVNSSSDTIFSIDWMSLSATSGAVGWYIKHNSGAYPGEIFQSTNTIQSHATSFDTVASSTYTLMRSSFQLALSSVAWVAGDNVLVSVCRDADNASDTMAGVARGILARFLFWRN